MFSKLRNWLLAGALALSVPFMLATQYPVHRWTSTQFITDGNGLIIGNTSGIAVNFTAETQVLGTASADSRVTIAQFSADANAPGIDFVKSRGTTIGTNTIVVDNDRVGVLRFLAAGGTGDFDSITAQWEVEVDDATPADDDVGMAFVWNQMPGGGEAMAETMRLAANGTLFINDTVNTNMAIGLTISQAQNDDNIMDFKSPTDVAHGGAGLLSGNETDTFASFRKITGAGGLVLEVVQDSTTNDRTMQISAIALDADVDAVDTSTAATIELIASQHDSDGTLASMEADANVFAVKARVSGATRTVFVVNEDGDTFIDGTGPTAFDSHRDAELLKMFESFYIAGRTEADFATMMVTYDPTELVAAGLVGELNEEDWNAGIRPLVPLSSQLTLLSGTARQGYAMMNALRDVLEEDPLFRGKMQSALTARGVGHLARP